MKFSESLKRNSDFQRVYREGKSYANRYLVLYVLQNQTERNRLGISVSKKVGNRSGKATDYRKTCSIVVWTW